jgi:uncharacterized membrane protein YesL
MNKNIASFVMVARYILQFIYLFIFYVYFENSGIIKIGYALILDIKNK